MTTVSKPKREAYIAMLQLLGWEPIQCKGVFPVPMLVKPTQRPAHYEAIDFFDGFVVTSLIAYQKDAPFGYKAATWRRFKLWQLRLAVEHLTRDSQPGEEHVE